jgi:arginine:ornithine antiporter/lysine permease
MILRGVKEAAGINTIVTIAKIVPICVFIVMLASAFNTDRFVASFWGGGAYSFGEVFNQVRSTMLVTVFVFIGIEGASVYSARAQKRSDVGRATVIGFLGVLALLVLVNVLSLGIMSQPELAKLRNPSLAAVLEHVVGHWGALLISVGLAISLLGALLSWALLCAEILFATAKDKTMPAFLKKENANHAPVNALWLTNVMIQIFLLITLFSAGTYTSLIYLASSMILVPYLWSAAYAVLLCGRGETYEHASAERTKDLMIGGIALCYAVWLLYAGGVKYLLLSALLYAPGVILFAKAKHEQGEPLFTHVEKGIFTCVMTGAGLAAYGLYSGLLSL